MNLVKMQCESCGSDLKLRGKNMAVCPHCESIYYLDKQAGRNITPADSSALKNGIGLLKLNKYSEARKVFDEYTKRNPEDWCGWLGLSLARMGWSSYGEMIDKKTILSLAPEHIREELGELKLNNEKGYDNEVTKHLIVDEYGRETTKIEQELKEAEDRLKVAQKEKSRNISILLGLAGIIILGIYLCKRGDSQLGPLIMVGLVIAFVIGFIKMIIDEEKLNHRTPEQKRRDREKITPSISACEATIKRLRQELERARKREQDNQKICENWEKNKASVFKGGHTAEYYISLMEANL